MKPLKICDKTSKKNQEETQVNVLSTSGLTKLQMQENNILAKRK